MVGRRTPKLPQSNNNLGKQISSRCNAREWIKLSFSGKTVVDQTTQTTALYYMKRGHQKGNWWDFCPLHFSVFQGGGQTLPYVHVCGENWQQLGRLVDLDQRPSFNTLMHNSKYSFECSLLRCGNMLLSSMLGK